MQDDVREIDEMRSRYDKLKREMGVLRDYLFQEFERPAYDEITDGRPGPAEYAVDCMNRLGDELEKRDKTIQVHEKTIQSWLDAVKAEKNPLGLDGGG